MANSTRTTRSAIRAIGSVLAAMLLAIGVLATGIGASAAGAAGTGGDAADGGAAWLAGQLDENLPMINFGSPDWGVTLDAGLALAATGTGGTQADAIWAAVEADPDAVIIAGGSDSPGRIAKAILLAHALGENPRAVGAGVDLVARLTATMRTGDDPDAGLFGAGFPGYDGAYRQGLSLAALIAAGSTPDPLAVSWLTDQQCIGAFGGAWMAYRSDTSAPCAYDFAAFTGPDTNATALAIGGLVAAGTGAENVEAGLGWLDEVQLSSGGWEQMEGFGQDPNSTALVIQAVSAASAQAADRFDDQESTPLEALLSYQLDCTAPEADRGAFTFPGSNDAPNGFATVQAVPAAAGAGFIIAPGTISDSLRPLDCTPPTTPSTTPSTPSTEPTTSTTSTSTTSTSTTAAPTSSTVATTSTTVVASAVTQPPRVGGSTSVRSSGTSTSSGVSTSASSTLATTGTNTDLLIPLGVIAALAGAILLIGSRRIRTS